MKHFLPRGSVISLFLLASVQGQAGVIFNYADFTNTSGLTLVGNAGTTTTGDGRVLRVTPSAGGQQGAAYSTTAVTPGSNAVFSTQFQFRFTSPAGIDPADGITFVLAASPSGLGTGGFGMGYAGVPNSVAVEFDTYDNGNPNSLGFFAAEPDSSNHIAIDTNGILQNLDATNVYGNGSCGFANGTPAQNTYLMPGCMSNGDLWTATITYDGSLLNVSVLDPAKGFSFTAINNYAINISGLLGTSNAYAGFTSSTGAGSENHDIVDWRLEDGATLTPEPASWMLAAGGALALVFFRPRKSGA